MKKQLAMALLVLTACSAHAQFFGDSRSRQDDAYKQYLACVKKYAESSAGQNALPSDIASAALSACDDHYQRMLLPTYELFGYTQWANDVLTETRQKARDYAIQAVLEARRIR
ncbi:hypothetical protein [Noviherbaspirillum pedocola]|uniref:Lipoprotein n=1 Tax=Noviherbaspirillum pedocola TaxID=2801341 RepID=A0A934SS42_9BURK|nr:hypothetical protein [Noviherbaspirillum pedocola]MBK4734151.1 hypothetical protein [Noviherbaspirillum pedocola]